MRTSPRRLLLPLACFLVASLAHDSCCKNKHKEHEAPELQYIPDPDESPPDTYNGHHRLIPDPSDEKPGDWIDEDDGPWQPNLIKNPEYTWQPKMIQNPAYVQPPTFWSKVSADVVSALPWVMIGVFVTTVLQVCGLPFEMLKAQLHGGGLLGALKGALLGLISPLCSCGSLPVAAGLARNGVPLGTIVAFLTATQSSGLDSAAITWGLLGRLAAVCRLLGAVLLAVAAGVAIPLSHAAPLSPDAATSKTLTPPSKRANLLPRICSTAVSSFAEVLPMVFLGITLSTAALHFLPTLKSVYSSYGPSIASAAPDWVATLLVKVAVLAAALPLQICEHTTVTLAAAIQKAGGSPGLAFAFLLSAPATNLPSLLFVFQQSGSASLAPKYIARVALALTAAALTLSCAVDAAALDLHVPEEALSAGGSALHPPEWVVVYSPWMAGLLAVAAAVRFFSQRFLLHRHSAPSAAPATSADSCCALPSLKNRSPSPGAEHAEEAKKRDEKKAVKRAMPAKRSVRTPTKPVDVPLAVSRERRTPKPIRPKGE